MPGIPRPLSTERHSGAMLGAEDLPGLRGAVRPAGLKLNFKPGRQASDGLPEDAGKGTSPRMAVIATPAAAMAHQSQPPRYQPVSCRVVGCAPL
jgi:hypothetical protein